MYVYIYIYNLNNQAKTYVRKLKNKWLISFSLLSPQNTCSVVHACVIITIRELHLLALCFLKQII